MLVLVSNVFGHSLDVEKALGASQVASFQHICEHLVEQTNALCLLYVRYGCPHALCNHVHSVYASPLLYTWSVWQGLYCFVSYFCINWYSLCIKWDHGYQVSQLKTYMRIADRLGVLV